MKVSFALLAAAPAVASAKVLRKTAENLPAVDIAADSKTGSRILSKSRRLDGDDDGSTWVAGYSIKFHSCVASQDYYGGYFADDGQDNANNYDYNGNYNEEGNDYNGEYNYNQEGDEDQNQNNGGRQLEQNNVYNGMYTQKLVHFQLCPSDSCSSWSSKNCAEYVTDISTYVTAVTEAKMAAQEYQCERVRNSCYCANGNENACAMSCFKQAGFDYCIDAMYEQQNENQFDLQEALECSEVDVDKEAVQAYMYNVNMKKYASGNYYNNNQENGGEEEDVALYVGPTCSADGTKILLGTFSEETCSLPAPEGMYEALMYGASVPYAKKSLVDSGCISCKEPSEVDNQNYWDQQDADEVTEMCADLYEVAGKCEEGLSGYMPYRNNMGCGFISSLKNPSLLAKSANAANMPAKVFAGIFGVTTVALAVLSAYLWKKSRRQEVSLTGGNTLA